MGRFAGDGPERAAEVARIKDYLLSTISHEMKTPVSLVLGYAELLEDRYSADELVQGISDGARRLATHLNRIVDLTAILGGRMPRYDVEISPCELVAGVRAAVEEGLAARGITLEVDVTPDAPVLVGDVHRLSQMLVELVGNARRHTGPGATVGIRVAPGGPGCVEITVWDTGEGIPEGQLERIWDAFNHVGTPDAERRGGLGLGLALVKGIAELHGGRAEVESPPAGGTRVTIRLPAHPDRV